MRKMNKMFVGVILFLSACTGTIATPNPPPGWSSTSFPTIIISTSNWTRIPPKAITASPSPTQANFPTPTWAVQGPGDLNIPIFLYHRIDTSPINSRYYVPPEKFEQELKVLRDLDYTSITTRELVQAITKGAKLPPHPILITFDDGHEDNYTNAFPIMQKYGFTGVLYIVGNYMGTKGFMNRDQILKMYNAGWEVGSHTMNHPDLTTLSLDDQLYEIKDSKKKLEDVLGIDILTFAYPFGMKDDTILGEVRKTGYIAAMGAEGYTDSQGEWNLYNLQRVEIKSSEDANSFKRFLTWKGNVE